MKNMCFIRVLSLFLLALLLLSSCQSGGETAESTVGEGNSSEEASDSSALPLSPLDIVKDGKTEYRIVRAEDGSSYEIEFAVKLASLIKEKTGVAVPIGTDFLRKGETHPENERLILVGNTNYGETKELYSSLAYGEMGTAIMGEKFVIAFYSEAGSGAMYNAISGLLSSAAAEGSLTVGENMVFARSNSTLLGQIPYYEGGSFVDIVDSSTHGKQVVLSNTTEEDYLAYLECLGENGFSHYANTEIGKNLFHTYQNEKLVLNTMYIDADKTVRIIADPIASTALPPRAEDNNYKATSQSSVTQVGLEQSDTSDPNRRLANGMQYIIKLADSSFVIIDGGFNYPECHKRLYANLKALADDPGKIVIAAWIITHFHGDHDGTIRDFGLYSTSGVTIERFIYNCPSPNQLKTAGNETSSPESYVIDRIARAYPKAERIVARPGQVFHLRNATFTVYATMDLLEPYVLTDHNNASVVFKMEIGGQSVLFTGDSQVNETDMLTRVYGKLLKSDFVQMIHHGADGATYIFYKYVDPQIVLWPVGKNFYASYGMEGTANNAWIFEKNSQVKEIHIAGDGVITLPLPYQTVTK